MMTPEERDRLERVEALLARAVYGAIAPQMMGGDITGTTAASVISQIAALAGGGTQLVVVDNAGNVLAAAPVLPMGGDITGTTAASVLSVIASLAGGGTLLVAVDNAGNVISAGAPPGAPDPFAFLMTITDNLVPTSAIQNYDFDLSVAAYTNSLVRLRAIAYGTTKDTAGVAGANVTGVALVVSDAVYKNQNGAVSLATAAAGGAFNPMPAINNEMTVEPQVADTNFQSGGGSPPNLAWTMLGGGTTARLVLTATNNVNRGSYQIDIYQRKAVAP